MARAFHKRLNDLRRIAAVREGYLVLARDASASVGQVAGICNTASMRPPFSMTLSVAGTHGDGERSVNPEIRKVARFEANQTD